jgi:hypothetical protein
LTLPLAKRDGDSSKNALGLTGKVGRGNFLASPHGSSTT